MSLPLSAYTIGLSGLFCFSAPFDTFFKDRNDLLTIGSLNTLGELYSNNVDPYQLYYAPYGVSDADYKKSVQNNDMIVGFKNSMDTWLYVPTSYITGLPNTNGLNYQITGISINLGALRVGSDLTSLMTAITGQIQSVLGITPKIEQTFLSSVRMISHDDAKKMESARNANKQNIPTVFQLQNLLITYRNQITLLEKFISCTACGDGTAKVFDSRTNLDCSGAYVNTNQTRIATSIPDTLSGADCDKPTLDAGEIFISENKTANNQ